MKLPCAWNHGALGSVVSSGCRHHWVGDENPLSRAQTSSITFEGILPSRIVAILALSMRMTVDGSPHGLNPPLRTMSMSSGSCSTISSALQAGACLLYTSDA